MATTLSGLFTANDCGYYSLVECHRCVLSELRPNL